jgi:glycosyltransferase involved in cell wall biosynthesis
MENAREVLEKRYPKYFNKLHNWNCERPIKYIGQNIAFELGHREEKENILFLIHDWKNVSENVGGTTLHAYDLIQNLREKYNFHVLAPENGLYKLYSYWSESESEITFPGVIDFSNRPLYNSQYKEILMEIVEDFNIGIVHIHHMIGHYFDIIDIISQFSLKSVLSIHDFYPLSLSFNKVEVTKKSSFPIKLKSNKKKVESLESDESSLMRNWNTVWQRLFKSVNHVVVPSISAKEELEEVYNDFDISVIEHGVDLEKKESKLSLDNGGVVDIAFVGVIVKHKGSEILRYLVKKNKLNNVRIHLFGVTDLPLKEYKYFINHGKYLRKDLPNLLQENKIKLVCLFSLVPETYSYTLTESVVAGVPVVGTDVGAIGERIRRDKLGWLIDPNAKYDKFADKINLILSNHKEYSEVIKNINNYKIRTVEEMSRDYKDMYHKLKGMNIEDDYNLSAIKKLIKESSLYSSGRVSQKYPDYSWVLDTFKWKMFEKLKIPKSIKNLYRKIKGG